MIGVLGNNSGLVKLYWAGDNLFKVMIWHCNAIHEPRITWVIVNFGINHTPDAGSVF